MKIKTTGPHLKLCYTDKRGEYLRAIWNIQISSKEDMKKFRNLIGFRSKDKNEKLESYTNNTSMIVNKRIGAENHKIRLILTKDI